MNRPLYVSDVPGLSRWIARRFRREVPFEDAMQECCVQLLEHPEDQPIRGCVRRLRDKARTLRDVHVGRPKWKSDHLRFTIVPADKTVEVWWSPDQTLRVVEMIHWAIDHGMVEVLEALTRGENLGKQGKPVGKGRKVEKLREQIAILTERFGGDGGL